MATILVMIILGLVGCFGVLMVMGGAMSDAPAAGDRDAKIGFIIVLVCVSLAVLLFVAKHNHWISP